MTALEALEAKARELCKAERTDERDDALANLAATFALISASIQRLAPGHDEAGAHFEELAEDCRQAVYEPSKPRRVFEYPERV